MIVSAFFSFAVSHGVPEKGEVKDLMISRREGMAKDGIDSYSLNYAKDCANFYFMYQHLLETNIKIYRYEDVIFKKEAWLRDMLDYLEIEADSSLITSVAAQNDIIPAEEQPEMHIRQVHPGNYKKHLQDETIEQLNFALSSILDRYGYSRD